MKIYNEVLDEYVEVPRPIKKIVSLDPATTETLFMLGIGDRIIATDAFSYRPAEAKKIPKIGSYTHVNIEFLEKNKPDIIFSTTGAQKDLTKKLINMGYIVYPIGVATSISRILNNIIIIANVIGRLEEGRILYSSLINALSSFLRKSEKRPKVYLEFDLGGPITAGFPTHVSDAIYHVGGKNIFDNVEDAYFTPSPNDIISREPDVIIYEPKLYRDYEVDRFKKSLEERGLSALLNKPILVTKGDFLAHQGPSFITEGVKWLFFSLEPFFAKY
ncbi:ABC transporter substrate-binding protein [Sulfurisphaera tokodaii]|uniref:ABC transporter substrate-binding protein n=2 Tax=Sulfurisphaera tokodaii TaxID=111955 RepID=Q96YH0_SULTO|nr:ABC transporter substrate-binding protein [Sulfurisphaera tokodaii]BAB67307.1 putative ABC transporter substrate-binding protein [Sulfurisphaera tokodaii str. 7]HII73065.1 ABC transporter substrate-binding protein [Sulfurisphaera tokodaii]